MADLPIPSAGREGPPPGDPGWVKKIELPNGLTFYLPAARMEGAVSFLVKEIFKRRRYAHPGFEIGPKDTVIDVGANMGLFVLWAAPQAAQGRLIAIEPTGVIDCLRLNVQLNGLKNVTAIRAAVGRAGQQLDLVEYPGFNIVTHQAGIRPAAITRFLIRLLYGKYRSDPIHTTAACLPLAQIMDENHVQTVDYLKMDCESGEYEIFRSMEPDHWQRIRRIALEFHELAPDQRHGELVAILEKAGFQIEIRKPLLDYYCMKFGEIWARRN